MFTTDSLTGVSYFQPCSLNPLHMFELFGIVFALAIYNGITLPLRLPGVFYTMLCNDGDPAELDMQDGIGDIRDGWPTIAKSLQGVMEESIEGMEYAFALEANGVRLTALPVVDDHARDPSSPRQMKVVNATSIRQDLSAGSSLVDVTGISWPGWTLTKADHDPQSAEPSDLKPYVAAYVRWLTYSSVAPQIDAFIKGFRSSGLFDLRTLNILGPANLKAFVEGSDRLNIDELRAAARYDGYNPTSKYIQNFWNIVTAWPEEKQKRLLKFVTAAERIPVLGAAYLTFIIRKAHTADVGHLPTSSTCFGTLMLPKYATSDILSAKLDLALEYGLEGFGTG